jgi:hypothetical protein
MLTDKIAQKLAPMYLSDISQSDALDLLLRAFGGISTINYQDQRLLTTDLLCAFYRTNRPSVLRIKTDVWNLFEADGCINLEGEEIREFAALGDNLQGLHMTLWTPRAVLRMATYLQNPIANSVRIQIAAFAASKTASNWRINESSALQPELSTLGTQLSTPEDEGSTLQPELSTCAEVIGEVESSDLRKNAACGNHATTYDKNSHSQ